jgi:hypothetical protein
MIADASLLAGIRVFEDLSLLSVLTAAGIFEADVPRH